MPSILQEQEKVKMLELLRKQEAESAKWEGEAQALTAELQSLRLDLINRDAQIRREEENSAEISQDLKQVLVQSLIMLRPLWK